MRYGIFTKEQHVEKIVNYLNLNTDIKYIISTNRWESEFYFDIGVSYCWPFLIKDLNKTDKVWYNYHPSPLSQYGGFGHWVRGLEYIRESGELQWGVSLSLIDEGIDTGPVLKTRWFPLETIPVNTQELADITHYFLFQLFKETIMYLKNRPLTKEQMENGNEKNP